MKSFLAFVFVLCCGAFFVMFSPKFEKNSPTINMPNEIFWNLKSPLDLKISDDTGIKKLKITLNDDKNSVILIDQKFDEFQKDLDLKINFPKNPQFANSKNFSIKIEITDASFWNFFAGNFASKTAKIFVDKISPKVEVLDNSYKISRGGSAIVVFEANDKNLKELYIKTKGGKIFKPTPFYKNDFYTSLIAWPIYDDEFRAEIIAVDLANNVTIRRIPLYLNDIKYKESTIELKDNFLEGKIANLVSDYMNDFENFSGVEKFKFINENLRQKNQKNINDITNKTDENLIKNFALNPFYPLSKSVKVGSFGDHRFYTKDGKNVSESWHMGVDFASVARAEFFADNKAKVVYANENGIFGSNIVLYHGLGFYTVYAHCSKFSVNVGDELKVGDKIANTGSSGLALGDHLHFGVIIQGVDVNPAEWMDKKWMNENIFSILENSKKIMDRN